MLAGSEGIWCGVVERELNIQEYEVFRHTFRNIFHVSLVTKTSRE